VAPLAAAGAASTASSKAAPAPTAGWDALLQRKEEAGGSSSEGLAVLYSGHGGLEKEVAEFVYGEAKARGLAVRPAAALATSPPATCRAAIIVCAAAAAPAWDSLRTAAAFKVRNQSSGCI